MRFIEDKHNEYKRKLSDSLEKEAVAFLNTGEGGCLYIGIDEKVDAVIGVENIDQVQLQIKDRFKNNIAPSILGLFDVRAEELDGVMIIKITVAGGLERPYHLKKYGMSEKGCYIRIGSAAEPMPKRMIDDLFAKRIRNSIGMMRSNRQELTFQQLMIFYQGAGLALNDNFARTLELLTPDGDYNYAAYLLADENNTSIKVGKYSGIDRVDMIENNEYGYCCLIKAAQRVLDKMEVENRTFTKITSKRRLQKRMIEARALREAVINAIIHNDYTNEVPPKFEFFSDRLEITSAGSLPPGLSREEFFLGVSIPRNKELMRVFKDMELVEYMGSGIPRILQAYDRSSFVFTEHFTRIVFPYEKGFEAAFSVGGVNGGVNGGVSGVPGVHSGVQSRPESRLESQPESLATKILIYIEKNPHCRIPSIINATGIPKRTVERYLKELKGDGKVEFIGATKTGGYRRVRE